MERDGITLRARTLLLGVLIAALVGAGAHGLLASNPTPASAPAIGAPAVATHGARSRAGAVRAAVAVVQAGQRIYDLPDTERAPALRALAAPTAADGFVAQQQRSLRELDGIAQRGQGPLTWDVSVLATRVDAWTPHRARIEIWRLGVLSIEGLTAPLAEYATVAYDLVWERGAWRVWSETENPGPDPSPLPESTPSSPAQWHDVLEGFTRYPGHEPI